MEYLDRLSGIDIDNRDTKINDERCSSDAVIIVNHHSHAVETLVSNGIRVTARAKDCDNVDC